MPLRFQRFFRYVQAKLMAVLLVCVLIFLGFLILNRYNYLREARIINQERQEERQRAFKAVFEAKSRTLESFVVDYTFWDDMVAFAASDPLDQTFATETVETALDSYDANAIWVYRADGALAYHTNNMTGDDTALQIDLNKERLEALFKDKPKTVHRFVSTSSGTLELYIASIHPGDDPERSTAAAGYFVGAKHINDDYLQDLSDQIVSSVQLVDKSTGTNFPTLFDPTSGFFAFIWPLESLDGPQTLEFYIASTTPSAQKFAKNYSLITRFYALGFFIMVIGLFFAILHWVTKPLDDISEILRSQDLAAAEHMSSRSDEFGHIGTLIVEAFHLSREIEKEKIGIEHKVTQRTHELHEAQARLEASINSLETGFLLVSGNDQTTLCNPALFKIFKLEDAPATGNNMGQIFLEQIQIKIGDTYNLLAAVQHCQEGGMAFSEPEIAIGKRYIRIFGAPVKSDNGTTIGCVLLIEDITDARRLERSKEEFVSIASHELRTPLTAIRGNAALLEDQIEKGEHTSPEEQLQMVSDIKDSASRLTEIVNQFLAMSRLEQGRMPMQRQTLDLGPLITNTVSGLENLAKDKGLWLKTDLPEALPLVYADPMRAEEVLTNLIGNAIKYTDKGGVTIGCEQQGELIKTYVSDSGKGISAENQDLLFKKFQQASTSILARDNGHSTGLGLYITKLMVEQMHGTVQLESSKPQKGSVFSFTLPVADEKRYAKGTDNEKPGEKS